MQFKHSRFRSRVFACAALALLVLLVLLVILVEKVDRSDRLTEKELPADFATESLADVEVSAVRLASPIVTPLAAAEASPAAEPRAFKKRGRLICIAEEMQRQFGANVQPVHEHVLGFKVAGALPRDVVRYYTVLRTDQSEALFVDKRFSKHSLILVGRVFPASAVLEVSGWQWIRDGQLYDVYYWCEVCSIRGFDPGSCACCQAPVELREEEKKGPRGQGAKGQREEE